MGVGGHWGVSVYDIMLLEHDRLRKRDTYTGKVIVLYYFCHPSEKGATLKDKNLLL